MPFLRRGGGAVVSGLFDNGAELPRVTPSTVVPTITGTTTTLTDTGNGATNASNLQSAINSTAALDGNLNHAIVLPAGALFAVPYGGDGSKAFALPARSGTNASGTGWIIIKSNGTLPARGIRVHTTDAAQLAQITLTSTGGPDRAMKTLDSARHYWLMGLELSSGSSGTQISGLVALGNGGKDQTGTQAHDLVIDRCYVHGASDGTTYNSGTNTNINSGITLNGGSSVVVDSWIAEIHHNGADAAGIVGWNGTGPFLIQNNHIEGSGENFMYGGSDPYIEGQTASDFTFIGNHFYKPPRWYTSDLGYSIKNLFEIKSGQRFLIEGNVFENHWYSTVATVYVTHLAASQTKAINFKSNNQADSMTSQGGDGRFGNQGQYWSTTADITFRNNIIKNACGGLTVAGNSSDGGHPTVGTFRVSLHDNLFYNIGLYAATTSPHYIISGGLPNGGASTLQNAYIANNSFHFNGSTGSGGMFWAVGDANVHAVNMTFKNNIVGQLDDYGLKGDSTGIGKPALDACFSSYEFDGNLLIGSEGGNTYPANNTNVANATGVWTNAAAGDLSLPGGSPALTSGVGGTYSGANVTAVLAATAGATA